jgi:Anti-anti-sigma regulatory factor (antagonist of anti-sigma factor)
MEQTEGQCLIRLDGEVGIVCAGELKKVLLEALASERDVLVDLQQASELDVTAMQLLWAAEREASKSGRRFFLAGKRRRKLLPQ